ncbi:uncharacterized protein LOC141651867 [Silene latifolia]|uniref:uncharacterized protein LOC141651867 n=1 Tax=Silene latifolia TaxID=37657 RepID=UPI003D786161
MDEKVIECWSLLLNRLEAEDCGLFRSSFFGIRHMEIILNLVRDPVQQTPDTDRLYNTWDVFRTDCGTDFSFKADLIFVPIKIEAHYACVCINFNSRTIDLLDCKYYSSPRQSEICKAGHIVASLMSDYVESRVKEKNGGKDIPAFQFRQIPFAWHHQTINDTESGLFAMMHMLMYEGERFDHVDLDRKVNRRYLVIQLAATLLLADMNIIREGVLDKVNGFIGDKLQIAKQLEARRKAARRGEKKPAKR